METHWSGELAFWPHGGHDQPVSARSRRALQQLSTLSLSSMSRTFGDGPYRDDGLRIGREHWKSKGKDN